MSMSRDAEENYRRQMQSFELRMDTMIALLEALVKQGEEITKLANKVSDLDRRLHRFGG